MKFQPLNPFRSVLHDSVSTTGKILTCRRRTPIRVRAIAAIVALALPLMQTATAVAAEQVLELPQAIATPTALRAHHHVPDLYDTTPAITPAPDANADANAGAPDPAPRPTAVAANTASYPPDPNVGSISDYQNQPGENGQSPSFSFGAGGRRSEPHTSMTTHLVVGGILLGMMALEIAAHHR